MRRNAPKLPLSYEGASKEQKHSGPEVMKVAARSKQQASIAPHPATRQWILTPSRANLGFEGFLKIPEVVWLSWTRKAIRWN